MACSRVNVASWMHLRTESGNTLHLTIVSTLAVHSVPTFGQFLCFSLPVCAPHDKSISMMVVFHQLLQHTKRLHWQLPCGRNHNASCTCNQNKTSCTDHFQGLHNFTKHSLNHMYHLAMVHLNQAHFETTIQLQPYKYSTLNQIFFFFSDTAVQCGPSPP